MTLNLNKFYWSLALLGIFVIAVLSVLTYHVFKYIKVILKLYPITSWEPQIDINLKCPGTFVLYVTGKFENKL